MPRILALDWDPSHLRCVLATVAGQTVRVLRATAMPLTESVEADVTPAPVPDLRQALQSAVSGLGLGRVTTIIGLGRASVEMFNFSLPPATDAELALLVQNQIQREVSSLTEADTVDFAPVTEDPTEPRPVTVAVLPAERRRTIQDLCQAAGVKPSRIILRPLAAAAHLVRTATPPPRRCCLLVNLLADEVDLTVLQNGRPALLRTVRLPQGVTEQVISQRLLAEINRTLLVAQQLPGGSPPEQLFVFGAPGEHQSLTDQLESSLTLPLTVLDPFEGLDTSGVELPEHAGRFASLLGAIRDEAANTHALDFLHPKRPPRPANRRRAMVTAAAVLGVLAAIGGYLYWDTASTLQAQIRELAKERKELVAAVKKSQPRTQLYTVVRNWKDAEIVWLDELRELSLQLPPSRDLLVHRLTFASSRAAGGTIGLQGVARAPQVIARIDRELHTPYRTVSSKRVGDYPQGREYSWIFERTMTVVPRDKETYLPEDAEP